MKTKSWTEFIKYETILLSILLYVIVLVYAYQYFKIADKYGLFSPDEFFYYIEAKAVSAYNIYQTPLSLDGNTSLFGDFGSHGISYALKDGLLAKIFFHANDPPIVWVNFITCLAVLTLILLFKPFNINLRLKIALVIATHQVLYTYTLSYMQETIQFLFAVVALGFLYRIYNQQFTVMTKYLYYYLIIIIIAITFRYSWFIWGLGLLPLSSHYKDLPKWILVFIGLMGFAIFIGKYIYAPYPYEEIVAYRLISTENLSLLDSLNIIWQKIIQNLQMFLTPDERLATTCMRYLLLIMLIINTSFAIIKRNRFTIACTLISWAYLVACLSFYFIIGRADERILAVLNPLLAFSLIGNCNSFLFYPIIAIQLFLFPNVVKERSVYYMNSFPFVSNVSERISKDTSYTKIKDLIPEENAVISIPSRFVLHSSNYFVDFPLSTSKGHPIHYYIYMNGKDLRGTHHPQYQFATEKIEDTNNQLIYSDRWMYLYKILN